jgi:hypothetical protein
MDVLPIELVREVLGFLKPAIISPQVAEGAIRIGKLLHIPNWWSRGSQSPETQVFKGGTLQYREILPLRL